MSKMNKEPEFWFSDSEIISLYLEELYWLSVSINTKTVIDEETQVKQILKPRKNFPNETKEEKNFRIERGEFFPNILTSIKLSEIVLDDVRNALKHFGDRLDRLRFSVGKNAGKRIRWMYSIWCSPIRTLYSRFRTLLEYMLARNENSI